MWYSYRMKKIKDLFKNKQKLSLENLNKWNISLAIVHAIQGILVLVISKTVLLPVSTNYLTLDPLLSQGGQPVLAPATRNLFDINMAYIIAAFFFISAIAHLIVATVYKKKYEAGLKKGINKARWIEYSVSASTMMIAIALLSGVYDISSLIMIFALDFIMNMMGLAMELWNQNTKKTSWFSYAIGCVAGIVPWVVFAIYVWGANAFGSGNIPAFVYWIYLSIFIFFNCFAINMYLQYKKIGKWSNYLYGERVYMILSLVAKTVLAWQVFAGILRP